MLGKAAVGKRKVNIAVFGGSNSAMTPGYLSAVTEILTDVHQFDVKVANVSTGANTSAFGLLSMKMGREIETNDVFIIEYGINDYELRRPDTWVFYCGIVEGMVREVLQRNHRAQVFIVHFGRRPRQTAVFHEKMLQFSLSLCDRYGVHTVPVDAYLKKTLQEDEFAGAYSDDMHYRRHLVTSFIGTYVANFIAAALFSDTPPRHDAKAQSALTFEDSVALHAQDVLSGPPKTFENTRYLEQTITIASGKTVAFAAPGNLLLVRYVSSPASCRVTISDNDGEGLTFDTLCKEVASGKFPFLVRSTAFSRRNWLGLSKGRKNEITIAALPKDSDRPLTVERGDMLAPTGTGDLAFHLSAILVC